MVTAAFTFDECLGSAEADCTRQRLGLLIGGISTGAVGGGFGYGFGLRAWRQSLSAEPPEDVPSRYASVPMRSAGIALVVIGAAAMFAGFALGNAPRGCAEGCNFGYAQPVGPVLFAVGSAPLTLGIPFLVLGAYELPEGAPTVRGNGRGLVVSGRF
jgi:hypothetical protein